MSHAHSLRAALVAALVIPAIGAGTAEGKAPVVKIEGGAVRGVAVAGGDAFRGLPYPLAAYGSAPEAFSTLVSDASFVCPALQVDRWTSRRAPTFAYEFNDDNAPQFVARDAAARHHCAFWGSGL